MAKKKAAKKKVAKKKPGKHYRDAGTGKQVTKAYADANPKTTVGETARKKK